MTEFFLSLDVRLVIYMMFFSLGVWTMLVQDIIARKRDGKRLTEEEIRWFIEGYTRGDIPDYQAAALLMAIYLNGLDGEELHHLTHYMLHSGDVIDLSSVPGTKVDKHSTGGVGDKISLPLAPLVASWGVKVPMMSGRGLGHTGGTLDKLESIPGFRVGLSEEEFINNINKIGVAMIGQTGQLAPADKKLYALRDATATVPSIPLISASIMSKKLAEGIDALVLDVKTGSGAFMRSMDDAEKLARTMVDIGKRAGKRVTAFITRMDDPLGNAVGNANEMIESIETLKGNGPEDIEELLFALGSEMLVLGGVAKDSEDALLKLNESLDSGRALDKMREMIEAQGGDPRVVDDYSLFPGYENEMELPAPRDGFVTSVDSTEIGLAGVLLGAGREKVSDDVDHGVGFTILKKTGDEVRQGDPLMVIHYSSSSRLDEAVERLKRAYVIGDDTPEAKPLIYKMIRSSDL